MLFKKYKQVYIYTRSIYKGMENKTFCKCGSIAIEKKCQKTEQDISICDSIFYGHSDSLRFIKGGLKWEKYQNSNYY